MNNQLKAVLAGAFALLIALLLLSKCHSCRGEREVAVADPPVVVEPEPESEPVYEPEPEPEPEPEAEDESDPENIGGMGDLKFVLTWEFPGDIDIHVKQPNGSIINFMNRRDSATGGELDVDNLPGGRRGSPAAENVYWPNPPAGRYIVSVNYYSEKMGHTGGGPVTVTMFNNGERSERTVNLIEERQTEIVYDINYTPRTE